ncbi:F-box protein At5g41720 [Eutrema salsugineum]|uniref:F-box protein At5g41720 n=1 Tax=Eutrema salsugineum TaxID=72664 RepID=UPI000CED1760|nr:F-box protein At5g41720 [Eutrema salsugineum]
MSSPAINQDMILEILSRSPASDVGKYRLLNKDCNKRSYESWFLNINLLRTNSISGYLAQYNEGGCKFQTSFVHERRGFENNGVSMNFLPPEKVKIEACDASHGIFLCANETGPSVPEYIVCKPTTEQYQIIPSPQMQNCSISFGLTVIRSKPFRYPKLVRFEGKLGVIRWWMTGSGEELNRLWVLKSSCEKSWVKVKDIKCMGLGENVVWTPSNDVITLSSWDRFCFYNINTEKLIFHVKKEFANYICFPFCSDYERVDLNERRESVRDGSRNAI